MIKVTVSIMIERGCCGMKEFVHVNEKKMCAQKLEAESAVGR